MPGRSARRLAALLPVLLCTLWSILLPASEAWAQEPSSRGVTAARAEGTAARPNGTPLLLPAPGGPSAPGPVSAPAAQHLGSPEPQLAPTSAARLPAAVENPVRLPGTPVATAPVPADLTVPARGVLAGDPRRERAPPGASREPRAPRGPPATRHS
ncbi:MULTISPECIES: hypothetical protein [unclassified Streptomyces]|uniref:hypothetical protein n=1 Tax=unclassified Streptomyces TaxID=2593676 RepID=UPI001660A51A|nr:MULTISPECIES: hypothetical protein [unclassified Streptomyces]MBD0706992.1 hypothetical protein [Streptomyces sp. CBMA291]MBD0712931.1 hypothetical protein [Streptomyces sp. CBMA370]